MNALSLAIRKFGRPGCRSLTANLQIATSLLLFPVFRVEGIISI
jgi:hypothetical protein